MNSIELTGLNGTNPMAFLAALGVANVLSATEARLEWSAGPEPMPILHTELPLERVVQSILDDAEEAQLWEIFEFKNLKLSEAELDIFFDSGLNSEMGLRSALLSDVAVDGSGKPKPTDLYFCAGSQNFLAIAKKLIASMTEEKVLEALVGPWLYSTKDADTFMWDTRDDRNYALLATNPSKTDKTTIPGADWLAFRGLGLLPGFGMIDRMLNPGVSGGWKKGFWAWVLWRGGLPAKGIQTLMQSIPRGNPEKLMTWDPPRGIFRVYQSQVVRSEQGGYGTIRPPKTVWSEA